MPKTATAPAAAFNGAMIRSLRRIDVIRFPWMVPILSVFLFVSEAHVSQSAHYIALEKLIAMSESILLVRKGVPFSTLDSIPTDSTGIHPDFHTHRHHYLVLKVLKSESLNAKAVAKAAAQAPIKVEVEDAFKDRRFEVHHRYHVIGMSTDENYSRYDFDRNAGDKDEEIIVFLSYDPTADRYAYRVDLAMERKDAMGKIEAIIKPKRKFRLW